VPTFGEKAPRHRETRRCYWNGAPDQRRWDGAVLSTGIDGCRTGCQGPVIDLYVQRGNRRSGNRDAGGQWAGTELEVMPGRVDEHALAELPGNAVVTGLLGTSPLGPTRKIPTAPEPPSEKRLVNGGKSG
jgi:hypothetical protein